MLVAAAAAAVVDWVPNLKNEAGALKICGLMRRLYSIARRPKNTAKSVVSRILRLLIVGIDV